MARSGITSTSIDGQVDNGGILWSIVIGEQLEFEVTLDFLTDMTGYTFEAVILEAANVEGDGSIPTTIRPGGIQITLDSTHLEAPNKYFVRFPKTLGSDWLVKPTVTAPVHGFFELRVTEPAGAFPQTFKPLRGVVELVYSPTDLVADA